MRIMMSKHFKRESLTGCSNFDDKFVEDFFDAMKRKGSLDHFEGLQVEGCDKLQRNIALKYLPSSKVVWEETRRARGEALNTTYPSFGTDL